jgi:hypothetical protein
MARCSLVLTCCPRAAVEEGGDDFGSYLRHQRHRQNPARQPPQICTTNSNAGTVAGANVAGVANICCTKAYAVSGLTGTGLILQDNNGDNLPVTTNGALTFATAVASGAAYNVSVEIPSSAQTCTVPTTYQQHTSGSKGYTWQISGSVLALDDGTGPEVFAKQ